MSSAQAESISVRAPGGAWFVASARQGEVCGELAAQRFLVARAGGAGLARGGLRAVVDEAVERALAMRGALPPGVEVEAGIEATFADQLFRARTLGAAGLVLALPSLAPTADGRWSLGAEDSAVLCAWAAAARRAPVLLVLDEADRHARVLAPTLLEDLASSWGLAPAAPPEIEPPPADMEEPPFELTPSAALPPVVIEPPRHPFRAPAQEPAPHAFRAPATQEPAPHPFRVAADAPREAPPAPPPPPPEAEPEPAEEPAAARVLNAAEWRAHAVELDKARGPKPVAVIEKLFVTRYVPLLGAVARGEADAGVRSVVETFRTNFEHSYRDAYAALRVTGKRPPMVFDAPDLAARIGRLNGARAIKLLLVDAMRYDVGERVTTRLEGRLAGRAVCIERCVLWAALPTTTAAQLALLAKGPEGLREPDPTSEKDPEIMRGRAISTLRRERVGSREVMKLDLVEARLRTAGGPALDRLDGAADEVAEVIGRYVETLPPRTLLFVFGDHGFRLPASADGRSTGAATQGGVSPEEVLVPGDAWLVGEVH
jgi:hypothetical protein